MGITLSDIAQEAGVNVSTVSRALNARTGVRKELRDKVLDVARRLRYRPNLMARGLVTGRSHTLGLLISDIRNPFFSELARGAEDAAKAAGYDVVLCNSDLDPVKQMEYFWSLVNKHVDGIIMNSIGLLKRDEADQLVSTGTPVVLLNRTGGLRNFSSVLSDNARGGFLVGRHLTALGHRKIAVLTGPRRHGNMADRLNGFLKALRNVPGAAQPEVLRGAFTAQGGYEMARRLLACGYDVTAIFAASDAIAFGVIRAVYEAGLRIPDDLSLIGFDDVEMAAIVQPPLTTIYQPKYEIGGAAVEILLKEAANRETSPEHRIFDVKLVERQSCRRV